jgi:hypothetical protein
MLRNEDTTTEENMATVTQTSALGPVSVVELRGVGELTFEETQADTPSTITVEAAEEIMPRLRREVRDGRLLLTWHISGWDWLTWWFKWATLSERRVKYLLKAPHLDEISLTGAGKVIARTFSGDRLSLNTSGVGTISVDQVAARELVIRISGSGSLKLGGQVEDQGITISGAGKVDCADLEARHTRVQISGAGSAKVKAGEELAVVISGAGRVSYVGEPRQISQRITGTGRIEKVG